MAPRHVGGVRVECLVASFHCHARLHAWDVHFLRYPHHRGVYRGRDSGIARCVFSLASVADMAWQHWYRQRCPRGVRRGNALHRRCRNGRTRYGPDGPRDRDGEVTKIVKAIIGLAHNLGLSITAEGVETMEQLAFLREQGTDQLQGFLLGQPMDSATISELHAARVRSMLIDPEPVRTPLGFAGQRARDMASFSFAPDGSCPAIEATAICGGSRGRNTHKTGKGHDHSLSGAGQRLA